MSVASAADAVASQEATAAFEDFVRPYWDAMARLARRLGGSDWEDVLQDALVLAWRKRDRYDAERGTALTWLLTLTTDAARKAMRKRGTALELVDAATPEVPLGVDIERAVARLTARQRVVVELHYYLGLPVAEIAIVMRCSDGTVKSTLSDARTRLRECLGGDYR